MYKFCENWGKVTNVELMTETVIRNVCAFCRIFWKGNNCEKMLWTLKDVRK